MGLRPGGRFRRVRGCGVDWYAGIRGGGAGLDWGDMREREFWELVD